MIHIPSFQCERERRAGVRSVNSLIKSNPGKKMSTRILLFSEVLLDNYILTPNPFLSITCIMMVSSQYLMHSRKRLASRSSLWPFHRPRLPMDSDTAKNPFFSSAPSSASHRSTPPKDHSATGPIPIEKILVANRGEIACRVMRTAQKWKIPTVALYSSMDGPQALHAQMAHEAYRVGTGPAASESYLLQEEIVSICLEANVTAVHPGYGFLSESSTFCELLSANNIKFIGPPVSAIEAMGSKSKSKAIMENAGVPYPWILQ